MSIVLLIRHAHSQANEKGILSGQLPGVFLSSRGESQAENLSKRLAGIGVKSIHISPMERCQQTIAPWLRDYAVTTPVKIVNDFIEVDYGTWSGKKLSTLSRQRLWKTVQNVPSQVQFPAGESMTNMSERTSRALASLVKTTGNGLSIVVSHGDVIKSLITHALGLHLDELQRFLITHALGLHLDELQRFVVDPASITILDFGDAKPRLLAMNDNTSNVAEIGNINHSMRFLVGGGAGMKVKQ
ncbi:MAG: histidine phosphatase family protein [Actinobacteria bacterium]|nr:histidine phosphatase family protein [Actinomycetota bacterium]